MTDKKRTIFWIIIFNLIIVFAEIFFGAISNSYALIADALHNAGDVLAIVVTYIALVFSAKKATFRWTFGFLKAEMMAGFVNIIFLYITMIYIIYESFVKLIHPQVIEATYMIVVGFVAVVANGISAYFLHKLNISSCSAHDHSHHHHEDINIKSAYLHMLSDAMISVGVIVAGIFIYFFKIYYIDSILAILFSIYILFHSYGLLKKSFFSLMDINRNNITKEQLDEIILYDNKVLQYHDLHISNPNSKSAFISFHLVIKDEQSSLISCENITDEIREKLKRNGFDHIVIQTETNRCLSDDINCCVV